jgi:hypothetical protein
MIDKATVTGWIRDLAAGRLDNVLLANGSFTRVTNSATYTRKVTGGKQRIHLDLYVRPSYSPDSFHLSLRCSVAFPDMAKIGAAMLGQNASGFGRSGTVDIAALDHIEMNPPMMLFRTASELEMLGPDIESHLVHAVVPYLDDRDTVAKLTSANWRRWSENTQEPGNLSHLPVIIAAGRLASGDTELALKTLEECYPVGTRGREMYSEAFTVARATASGATE